MDAPLFRYWQALYQSLYSRRLYVDVAKRWRGVGCLYLLLLLSIVTLPFVSRVMVSFNQYFDEKIIFPLESLPPLLIHNGQLLVAESSPYLIKNKQGEVVSIVDPTGSVSQEDSRYPNLVVLVSRDQFYWHVPCGSFFSNLSCHSILNEPVVYELGIFDPILFYFKTWLSDNHVYGFKWFVISTIYPVIICFMMGLIFSLMMVFTMLAQVFSWLILSCKLDFMRAARLLIVSSTLPLSVFMMFLAANALFQGLGVYCAIVWAVYFSFGVLSFKRESGLLVHV